MLISGLTRTQQTKMIEDHTELSGHDSETVRILLREYMRFCQDEDYTVSVSFTSLCLGFNPETAQTPLQLSIAKLIKVEYVA